MARLSRLLRGRGSAGSSSSVVGKLFTRAAGSEARAEGIEAAPLGGFAFPAIAATSASTTAALLIWCFGRFHTGFRGGVLRFGGSRSCGRCERPGTVCKRRRRFRRGNRGRRQLNTAGGLRWIRQGNFSTESDCRLLCFYFPIGPAKTLRGGKIPFGGFRILSRGFEIAGQLKGNHGVVRFLKQIGELPDRILTSAGPTNPGGDLFPVSHVLACIVAAEGCDSQSIRAVRGVCLFAHLEILH